jgi:CubicO group peptidase (beta-lactamase class C family)
MGALPTTPEKLQALLDDAVARGEEHACQLAVYHDGELFCDLAAGAAAPTTYFPLFSAGKGPLVTAVLRLVERGVLELDAPVARYWPEFAANGKERITLRDVLTHRAGMHILPPATFAEQADWDHMCALLASRRPVGVPGTRTRYQALTFAWLAGEPAARAAGRDIRALIRDEALVPAGIDDFGYGVAPGDEARTLHIYHAPEVAEEWLVRFIGDPDIRRACIPSANAFGTARALAQHYMAVLDGLLSPDMLASALTPPDRGADDPVRGWERFGLGYILWDGGAFGHGGALGAEGLAVPERRIAVGFATDTLRPEGHPVRDRISAELGIAPRHW